MNVELICVGSELLSGDIVNTNAAHISKRLRELGHESMRQHTIDDHQGRIVELVKESLSRCDILILTGGLGPTADDLTKEAVCEAIGLNLTENAECRKHLDKYFKDSGKKPTSNNFKQATAPEGAKIFKNDLGTACGICVDHKNKRIIMLPGPHRELVHMFDNYVVPYLKKFEHRSIVTHTVNVFGLGESLIETIIKPFCEQENPIVATYCGNNECSVKITATADTEEKAESICNDTLTRIKSLLGDNVYGVDSLGLAHEVVGALRNSGLKISTAESCTGGMLSQALTSVSHSSEVVEIGILAYSNRIKNEALSVPNDVLNEYGAISPETAMYLAKNVRILSDSDIGVGITGNAGPTASENKPVGLVYVSIADKTKFFVKKLELPSHYDREKIRSYATLVALDLVRKYIAARPAVMSGMLGYEEPYMFEEDKPKYKNENLYSPSETYDPEELNKNFDPNMNFIVFDPEEYDENIDSVYDFSDTVPENAVEDKKTTVISELFEKKVSPVLNTITSFLKRLFPNKNDKAKELTIKIVSIVCVIALIVSSFILITNFTADNHQRNIIENAREDFEFDAVERNDDTGVYKAFEDLIKRNPDIKAWISVSNTSIDNPVYQTDNNDYYLNHNMNKNKSRYGALFFDYQNSITKDGNSKNLTIYGHNMKDKSMFGALTQYRSLKFYKNNPTIELKTLYDQKRYIIFAVMVTNAVAEDDNGYVYNFTKSQFNSDEEFNDWIAEAKERSLIDTNIEVANEDEIITLSTYCDDFDNARFVVMAKSLSEGDTAADAKLNSNVRYPQAWYDKKGLDGYTPSTEKDQSSSESASSEDTSSESDSSDTSSDIGNDFENTDSSQTNSSDVTSSTESTTDTSSTASTQQCDHLFGEKIATDVYLITKATCTHPATYYISCSHCGEKSDLSFEYGSPLGHSPDGIWHYNETEHSNECTVCKQKINVGIHTFDETQKCQICGYIKVTE